jgi:hypothetical protein
MTDATIILYEGKPQGVIFLNQKLPKYLIEMTLDFFKRYNGKEKK